MSAGLQHALTLEQVGVAVGGRPLFAPLTVTIAGGEILTVMGASGSGKSSLVAWLSGALDPALTGLGRVRLDGVDVTRLPPERRRIGILFQDDLLFPHLSVGGNLGFALPADLPRSERRDRIESALAEAELAGFAGRDPASLSGGQRARVAVMRTLLAEPRALLLDEPFAKLDAGLRDQFRSFVFNHALQQGVPVLLVTHDAADADAAAGTVVMLSHPE
ncbi:MAG: ATP-binding cassette domain-containing protein [Alphaproteobacteria bacterium]